MDETLTPVDAGQVSDEGSQIGAEQVETVSAENGAAPVQVEKPVQTPEENARFAAIRREAEARARQAERQAAESEYNSAIAKLGIEWDGKPVATIAELNYALEQKALQEQAQTINPVEVLAELQNTKLTAQQAIEKLSRYERMEALSAQAQTLSSDPKWSQFYKSNEAVIRGLADRFNCDLDTAMLVHYRDLGPQMVDEKAIAEKAVQEYLTKKTSVPPTEGSGAAPVTVVGKPLTFDEAGKIAFAKLRASREQT